MIEIKDLLLKFDNLILKEEVKKETIRFIISKVIGLNIKSEDINIKNNVIYLNIKPIYKSEILLKKDLIFHKFKEVLNKKLPIDIR
jgi:nucleoside-specific outer membrane channel protein Tsx